REFSLCRSLWIWCQKQQFFRWGEHLRVVPVPIIEKSLCKRLKTDFHQMKVGFYQSFNSPMRRSSTTACERPLTPNFCIAFEMWLLTVFSDMNKSWAISFVVLS